MRVPKVQSAIARANLSGKRTEKEKSFLYLFVRLLSVRKAIFFYALSNRRIKKTRSV